MTKSIFIHIMFILMIGLLLYGVYGALRKGLAERTYDQLRRYFPSYLIWPKTLRCFAIAYKVLIIVMLPAVIAMYIWTLTVLK